MAPEWIYDEPYTPPFNSRSKPIPKPKRNLFAIGISSVVLVIFTSLCLWTKIPGTIIKGYKPPFAPQSTMQNTTLTPTRPALETQHAVIGVNPTFTPTIALTKDPLLTPIIVPTVQVVNGKLIAFVSNRTGTFQVWTMLADGTNETQVTSLPEGACQPEWSPDATRLAVVSPCDERKYSGYPDAKIYIVNLDGSGSRLLMPDFPPGDFDPAWSPDGKRLAFTSLRSGVSHIFVYNFEDETIEELSDSRMADMQPAWNPSGKQIAFIRQEIYFHIFMMSDLGQTQYQFSSSGNVNDYWPVWSSDGSFLIYNRMKDDPAIPWLVSLSLEDRGSGKEKRIPDTFNKSFSPIAHASLSPDDAWLVFESWPDGKNHDIYLMEFNGDNLLRMTTDPGLDFNPVWQP